VWFDDAKRQAIAEAFAEVIRRWKYTVWACAILPNHAHLCVRRHRDDAETMWHHFADQSRARLRLFADVPANHPIWSNRPYKVFLYTPDDVRGRIDYIAANPAKHRLASQTWPFVQAYDGWPLRRR
jgi:REP element-mobilizing transposase RayT